MAVHRRTSKHLWLVLALAALPVSSSAVGGSALIYVTNSAGDNIHVIDPATNKVVQEIKGVEAAHGIVAGVTLGILQLTHDRGGRAYESGDVA